MFRPPYTVECTDASESVRRSMREGQGTTWPGRKGRQLRIWSASGWRASVLASRRRRCIAGFVLESLTRATAHAAGWCRWPRQRSWPSVRKSGVNPPRWRLRRMSARLRPSAMSYVTGCNRSKMSATRFACGSARSPLRHRSRRSLRAPVRDHPLVAPVLGAVDRPLRRCVGHGRRQRGPALTGEADVNVDRLDAETRSTTCASSAQRRWQAADQRRPR